MPSLPDRCMVLLDVGHGNCTLVRDGDAVCVIDTGPGVSLLEFLTEQQIRHIDAVLISHADQDHISGLIALLASNTVRIDRVRLNTDALKESKIWDDLTYELEQQSAQHRIDISPALTRSDTGRLDCGMIGLQIVAPGVYLASRGPGASDRQGRRLTTNSVSAVVRIMWQNEPVMLLAGDIDAIGLEDMLDHEIDCSAPMLVWPHHGGRAGSGNLTEFAQSLCRAVQPETVFFSIGRESGYVTPRPELIGAIRQTIHNVRIACTQLSRQCAMALPDSPQRMYGQTQPEASQAADRHSREDAQDDRVQ